MRCCCRFTGRCILHQRSHITWGSSVFSLSNFDEIQEALDCVGFNGTTCTGFYATAVSEAQAMKNLSDEALLMA